jgi:hypothetical protein
MIRTNDQMLATAYHEAGHVVVAYYFGKFARERGVTVDDRGMGHAHIQGRLLYPINSYPEDVRHSVCRQVRAECMELFAGIASEERVTRRPIPNGGGPDWRRALALLETVYGFNEDDAGGEMRAEIIPATRRLLRRDDIWSTIEALSDELHSSRHLSMEKANGILERSQIRCVSHSYWNRRSADYSLYWARAPQ